MSKRRKSFVQLSPPLPEMYGGAVMFVPREPSRKPPLKGAPAASTPAEPPEVLLAKKKIVPQTAQEMK